MQELAKCGRFFTSIFAELTINGLKFQLLPYLKKWLSGKNFANNEEIDNYFEEINGFHY